MGFDRKFTTHFARLVGVATVVITYLYWLGFIELPHPDWSNMTIRIGFPMLVGWILVIFPISEIKDFIAKLVTKKFL